VKNRHVWPGNDLVKLGEKWTSGEILNQVRLTRKESGSPGNIFWSMKCLMENRGGFATVLERDLYTEPALVPASPWLDQQPPGKPAALAGTGNNIAWEPAGAEKASLWVLQTKTGGEWHVTVLPGGTKGYRFASLPDAIAVTAIDRCGVASSPAVLQRQPPKEAQSAAQPTNTFSKPGGQQ
jgi:hypothetical protein